MWSLRGLRVIFVLYTLSLLLVYYIGYQLFALDREIVYSWINVIHFINPPQALFFVLVSTVLAYILSRFKQMKTGQYVLVLLILALVWCIPFLGHTQVEDDFLIHYDAARHFQLLGVMEGIMTLGRIGYSGPPLLAILQSFIFRFFGEGYMQVEILQCLFFVLLSVIVFLIGKKLWTPRVGFHAGLLVIATPSILQQNYLFMQDIPVTFFAALTAYLALRSSDDRLYIPPTVLSACATILMKNSGGLYVFAIVVPIVWLKFFKDRDKLSKVPYFLVGVLFLGLLAATILLLLPVFREGLLSRLHNILSSYPRRVLSLSGAIPVTSVFFQIGFAQALLILPAAYLFAKKHDRNRWLLVSWILVPLIVLWGTRIRYMMPMFPALSLLVAAGLEVLDERLKNFLVYSAVLTMLLLTSYVMPQIVDDYVSNNIMYAAKETNNLSVDTVGVYTKFAYPWIKELSTASAVDYYSNKRVVYLGISETKWRQSGGAKYVLPAYYQNPERPSICSDEHFVFYWKNQTKTCLDELLLENYTLLREWSGGRYYYHDPYIVDLYLRKLNRSGPTDAIIYASNVRYRNVFYDFWNNLKHVEYPQTYHFGLIPLSSTYGVYVEDWLGERQLFVKPPDVGQMNATYFVVVPENSSLSFSISLRPDTWHWLKGDGVRFRVLVDGDVLLDRYLDPKRNEAERRLFHYRFPLGRYSGRNATFVFQTFSGPGNDSRWDTAGFGDPAVVWGF